MPLEPDGIPAAVRVESAPVSVPATSPATARSLWRRLMGAAFCKAPISTSSAMFAPTETPRFVVRR